MKPEAKRRVYFLGSGASADAGIPQLTSIHLQIAKLIDRRSDTRSLKELLHRFSPAGEGSSTRPAVVDFISLMDSCIRENRPLGRSQYSAEGLRRLRRQFTAALAEAVSLPKGAGVALKRLEDDAEKSLPHPRPRVPAYLRQYVDRLRSGGWDSRTRRLRFVDAIITTNYDTTVDRALYEHVYEKDPNLDRSLKDVFLGSDFRDPFGDEDAFSEDTNAHCLLKLHGSVNWLWCPLCGRIYVSAFIDNTKYFKNPRAHKSDLECHCDYSPLEPVIVAPSIIQDLTNPHLVSIWRSALHALVDASEWIMVGYSLPSEDIAVRALLYRAFETKRRKQQAPKITIVDSAPHADRIRTRYKRFFATSVGLRKMTFKRYIKNEMVT